MTAETFLEELKKIILSQPKLPSRIDYSENCESGDYIFYSKNLYSSFDCANCTDSAYLYDSYICANCLDGDYVVECELCYECVDLFKGFNCEYLENCARIRDAAYSYGCDSCHDVFGCVSLRNKSFCIFNRQLSEEEYREKVKKYRALPAEKILEMVEDLKKLYPWTQTNEAQNENTFYGNYIYYDKNCYLCFDSSHNENCAYLYDSHENSSSFDLTYSFKCELCYEMVDCARIFDCVFSVYSSDSRDSAYIFNCVDVKNCLGCVNLQHKEYCLLNRQLTKEDYEVKSKQILEELKNKNLGWNDLIF